MGKLKAYVVIPNMTLQKEKEINALIRECENHIDIIIPRADTPKEEIMDLILESQIIIGYLESHIVDYGVGLEFGIFSSSLETLRRLGVSHSPKLIIGQVSNITHDSLIFNIIEEYGVYTKDLESTLEALITFYNEYPF